MSRYARLYVDVDSDERCVAVGLAWCRTATVPIGPNTLRLLADSGCDVYEYSLN